MESDVGFLRLFTVTRAAILCEQRSNLLGVGVGGKRVRRPALCRNSRHATLAKTHRYGK